ncbi:MAG: polysaccharide pyruvyl transferase family protein [Nitrospira sp.]|nr:polysaccharide pyruvyl transferase family protein [Nitrospira sp.]
MRTVSATIVGYHGYKNFGDDIFLNIVCAWLNRELNVTSCNVTSKKGARKQEICGVEVRPFYNVVSFINRCFWFSIFKHALRTDYLIFSAGSIFSIQPFMLMFVVLKVLRLLKGNRLKVVAIGVSIGPFYSSSDRLWCSRALGLMDQVLLRDRQSSKLIETMSEVIHTRTSYDLALLWGVVLKDSAREDHSKFIALSITERGFGDCTEKHSNNCEVITSVISRMLSSNTEIKLRIFDICADTKDGDLAIASHLFGRLPQWSGRIEICRYHGDNLDAILGQMASCSAMICSRMHAGVMATLNQVPVFQISYAEKIRNFFLHSGLDTKYLVDSNDLNEIELYDFLHYAIAGDLNLFAQSQKEVLLEKGDQLRLALTDIASLFKRI